MARPRAIEVNPRGPQICTCCQPWFAGLPEEVVRAYVAQGRHPAGIVASHGHGWFVCDAEMSKGAEDGLCGSCRNSPECAYWREFIEAAQRLVDQEQEVSGGAA